MTKLIKFEESFLGKLNKIKTGLMQDLLTGKLRVANLRMSDEFGYVEKPFMDLLKQLYWETIVSTDDVTKFLPKLTLRSNFDDVIIEERLRKSIKMLNDWLDDEQIEEAINEIKRVGLRKGLVKSNEDFLSMLLEPPAFKNKNNLQEKSRNIKIIDFEDPLKNDFLAINQFRVNTPGTLKRLHCSRHCSLC